MTASIGRLVRKKRGALFLYGLAVIAMVLTLSCKKNYHVDEMYSYGLSNHRGGPRLLVEDGMVYKPADSPFLAYLTVEEGHSFAYANVWENQKNDTHPPLYYVLLHTVCSFFPRVFSPWFAGSLNILFGLLSLLMFRRILGLVWEESFWIDLFSLIFSLLPGFLDVLSFLRMYMMALFFCLLLSWLFFRQAVSLREGEAVRSRSLSFAGLVFLFSILSALTHYYCMVYYVFLSFVYVLFCLRLERRREALLHVAASLLSGAGFVWIFPPAIAHMTGGPRGGQAIENLKNPADYGERLFTILRLVGGDFFGGLSSCFALVFLLSVLFFLFRRPGEGEERLTIFHFFFSLPCLFYYLLVSKMAAYLSERYFYPVYGVFFASLLVFLGFAWRRGMAMVLAAIRRSLPLRKQGEKHKRGRDACLGVLLLLGCLLPAYRAADWKYLYLEEVGSWEGETRGLDCICLYDETWKLQPMYEGVREYETICFLSMAMAGEEGGEKDWRALLLSQLATSPQGAVVLSLVGSRIEEGELFLEEQKRQGGLDYQEIGKFFYEKTYRISRRQAPKNPRRLTLRRRAQREGTLSSPVGLEDRLFAVVTELEEAAEMSRI